MTDLLQRLRKYKPVSGYARYCRQAADEIERLRKEITGLQELKVVVENPEFQEVLFSSLNGKLKRLQVENAELLRQIKIRNDTICSVREELSELREDKDVWRQKAIELGLELSAPVEQEKNDGR